MKKAYVFLFSIILSLSIILITGYSVVMLNNLKNTRYNELNRETQECFNLIDRIVDDFGQRAETTCIAQFFNYDNCAIMFEKSYNPELFSKAMFNLQSIVETNKEINSVYLYNHSIDKFFSTSGLIETGNFFDKIKENADGKLPCLFPIPQQTTIYDNNEAQDVFTYIMYDYLDENDRPLGGMVINFNCDFIFEKLKVSGKGTDRTLIVDKNNRVLIDTADKYDFLSPVSSEISSLIEFEGNNKNEVIDGKKSILFVSKTNRFNWKYLRILDYDAYYSKYSVNIIKIILMAILFAIIAIFATWYIVNVICVPINKIKYAIEPNNGKVQHLLKNNKFYTKYMDQYVSDIASNVESSVYNFRNDALKKVLLYAKTEHIKCLGHVVMFKYINCNDSNEFDAYIFDMFNTYLSTEFTKKYNFIVINKNESVAIIEADINDINNVCNLIINDAKKCYVDVLVFVGEYISNVEQLHQAYLLLKSMSEYQKIFDGSMIFNSDDYFRYEKMALNINEQKLHQFVNKCVSGKIDYNKDIYEIIKEFSNNSLNGFSKCCSMLICAIKTTICNMTGKNIAEQLFLNIDIRFYTAEYFYEIYNIIFDCVNLLSEVCTLKGEVDVPKQIERVIDENITNSQLSVAVLADKLGVTQRKFSADCKKYFCMSANEKINLTRVKKAALLLKKNNNMSIKMIMKECGFVSESNFYKTFKKFYNVTPQLYRETVYEEGKNE